MSIQFRSGISCLSKIETIMCGEAISDERSDRRPVLLEPQIFASWRTVAAEQATDRRPFPNVSTQQPEPLSEVGWTRKPSSTAQVCQDGWGPEAWRIRHVSPVGSERFPVGSPLSRQPHMPWKRLPPSDLSGGSRSFQHEHGRLMGE